MKLLRSLFMFTLVYVIVFTLYLTVGFFTVWAVKGAFKVIYLDKSLFWAIGHALSFVIALAAAFNSDAD